MKINFILFLFILSSSVLHAEEASSQSQQISGTDNYGIGGGYGYGYGMGGMSGYGFPGGSGYGLGGGYGVPSGSGYGVNTENSKIEVEKIPNIEIYIERDKPIPCQLDTESKNYFCENSGKPILVKYSSFGFSAITKDSDNSATAPLIAHVEAEGKTIFEAPYYVESITYGAPDKLSIIKIFFESEKPTNEISGERKGVGSYQKVVDSFMEEKSQLEKVYNEKEYAVELENGEKVSCSRGSRKQLPPQYKDYEERMGSDIKCGSFKCDPIKVDGKTYQATMFFESIPGSMTPPSLHLIEKEGIGPSINIKKITSPLSSTPLFNNTLNLQNMREIRRRSNNQLLSMLPESLKEDREKIIEYKDPNFEQVENYYQMVCNDDNKALSTLNEGRKQLLEKLGRLELAEFIQVLGDGSLVGQYIDLSLARKSGCLYEGVYLDEEAARNLNVIRKNIHPDNNTSGTISMARATELFNKATKMDDIAWKYKPDGCYARAHLMARRFEEEGVRVDKVWIKGDLYVPGTEPLIEWNFHVAPIVYVKDEKGIVQKMVIDPSLFSKPVTVEEWDHKMSKKTARGSVVTAFPFPENAAFMERSALSFSSSDPYLPRTSIHLSEEQKMNQANQTMKMYKPMEPQE